MTLFVWSISIDLKLFFSCFSLRHFAWECLLYSKVSVTATHYVLTRTAINELIRWTSIFLNLHNFSNVVIFVFSPVVTRTFFFWCYWISTTLISWSSWSGSRSGLRWRVLRCFLFLTLFIRNLTGKQFTASNFVSDLKYLPFKNSLLFLCHFHEIVGLQSLLVFTSWASIVVKRLKYALTTNLLLLIF